MDGCAGFYIAFYRNMSSLHSNSYLDEMPSAVGRGRTASIRSQTRRRRYTFSVDKSIDTPADYHTSLTKSAHSTQQPTEHRCRSNTYALGDDLPEWISDDATAGRNNKSVVMVMSGWLHKTTRLKTSKTRGHRQYRRFRLTAHSLEYSLLFQKVCIASYI